MTALDFRPRTKGSNTRCNWPECRSNRKTGRYYVAMAGYPMLVQNYAEEVRALVCEGCKEQITRDCGLAAAEYEELTAA